LVHSVYELYGADVAGRLLGILSRLFTKFLQLRAFTCRMDDLALTDEGNAKRAELLRKGENLGTEGTMENFPSLNDIPDDEKPAVLSRLLREVLRDDEKMAGLDMTIKSRLRELTKSIALELAPNIRVCAVAPGYVLTPMQRAEYTDEMLEQVNQKIPLRRHAQPEEIAALFAFLASDDAANMTGHVYTCDGGETAGGLASR